MTRFGLVLAVFASFLSLTLDRGYADEAGKTAHDFSFALPNGDVLPLDTFKGKPVLIVNTATECGFSNQLSQLQELHEAYADRGLVVLGVPSNDFGGQEPRSDKELSGFCEAKYGAKFALTAKTTVKGKNAHPFYRWAVGELGVLARPYWNFHKYLVGPDGSLAAWYSSPTKPTSSKVRSRIEAILMDLETKQPS